MLLLLLSRRRRLLVSFLLAKTCVFSYKYLFGFAWSWLGVYSWVSRRGVEQFGSSPGS